MTLQAGGEGAGGEGVFSLFALNALYVSADTIACIASLWMLSARTDHALQVGVILGLGALLPPLLGRIRRASPRVDETRVLLLARGLGLVICLAAVPLAENLGWAAAGSVDTDLSFLRLFELYGATVAERRMPTRGVVEPLDVVEHVGARLVTGSVHLAPHALGLHGTEEALHG